MSETPFIDGKTWRLPPKDLELAPPAIDVWIADLNVSEEVIELLANFLSPDEQERARRFVFARDRAHYMAGRGILRSILGAYLKVRPSELRFRYNSYGKPYLADDLKFEKLQFNLAHSAGLALYALTVAREIGIDIERIRDDLVVQELAERFFAPEEVKVLMALPKAQQQQAFFECWTRKEAFIKARGLGLSLPLNQFVVAFGPGAAPAVVSTHGEAPPAAQWSVCDLCPATGYVGALVVEAGEGELRLWKFTGENQQ
jgi:4'-phosphopantetheinyl transferase